MREKNVDSRSILCKKTYENRNKDKYRSSLLSCFTYVVNEFTWSLILLLFAGSYVQAQEVVTPEVAVDVRDLTDDSNAAEALWKTIYRAPTVYPRRALKREINGCVLYSFVVGSDGKASEIEVLVSRPRKVFVAAGTKALLEYQWEATAENLQKTPVRRTALLQFISGRRQVLCEKNN